MAHGPAGHLLLPVHRTAVTTTQEGFRWRNDDGDEDGATWKAAQDTNASTALATSARLRVLLDTTGDVTVTPTLRYKKTTDGVWLPVPVGPGAAGTSFSDDFAGSGALSGNWTAIHTFGSGVIERVSGVADQISGARATYRWNTQTTTTNCFAQITADFTTMPDGMMLFVCGDGTWSFPFPDGYSVYINSPFWEIKKDGTTIGATLNESISAGVHTVRLEHDGVGNLNVYMDTVLKVSRTDGGTVLTTKYTGMGCGGSAVLHFDNFSGGDLTTANPVYIKTSTNITAGGEPTTAQLTAPSGKTTADFSVGRMWDDENGTDTVVIGGGFTPTDISGLFLWLDAADASTFTFSSGSVVSQWRDKSGNSRHVSQATTARQPTRNGTQNGLPTVYFDNPSQNWLDTASLTLAQPFTILIAYHRTTGVTTSPFGGIGGDLQLFYTSGNTRVYAGSSEYDLITGLSEGANVTSCYMNGASTAAWFNGASIPPGGAVNPGTNGTTAGIRVGGERNLVNYFGGEIFEILVYDSAISTSDRQDAELYLKTVWGTP